MKKFFMVMLALTTALIFSCNDTNAQSVKMYKTASVVGNIDSIDITQQFDTLTNTTVKYIVTRPGTLYRIPYGNYTLSFFVKSLTGIPATVNFVWESSFDGRTWFRTTGAYGTDGLNCDTLRVVPSTTAAQFKFVSKAGTPKLVTNYASTPVYNNGCRANYHRLRCIPSGTQTLRIYDFEIQGFQ